MEKRTKASFLIDEYQRKLANGEMDTALLDRAVEASRIDTAEALERGKHWEIHFEKEKREIAADLKLVGKRISDPQRKALLKKCMERIEKF